MESVLSDHMTDMSLNDEQWHHTTFYSGAERLIVHFSQYIPGKVSSRSLYYKFMCGNPSIRGRHLDTAMMTNVDWDALVLIRRR